jgi:hypothetical protein
MNKCLEATWFCVVLDDIPPSRTLNPAN